MVVGEDHGGRVEFQATPDNLARVDGCAVDGPEEQILRSNQAVPVVQKQACEHLRRTLAVVDDQVVRGRVRASERCPTAAALREGRLCGADDLIGRQFAAGLVLTAALAQIEEREFSRRSGDGSRIAGSHCRTSHTGWVVVRASAGGSLSGLVRFGLPDRQPRGKNKPNRFLCQPDRCIVVRFLVECSYANATEIRMDPKAVRETLGLTVTEMSRVCGIHYMTWSKWEKGEQRPPAIARRMFDLLLWLRREGLLEEAVQGLDDAGK